MPIERGKSPAVRSANIRAEYNAGYTAPGQAAAIEYNRERKQEGLRDPGYGRKRKKKR